MEIGTRFFGTVEIEEEGVLDFPRGILGMEEERQFVLLDVPGRRFKCMQSVGTPAVAFIVVNPWDYYPDYEFELSDRELEDMGVESADQLAVFAIVTIREPAADSTLNLLGPLVIHVEKRTGRQFVLGENRYSARMPLVPETGEADHADTD